MESMVRKTNMVDKLKIYKGKKVLITGHTGFKGSWLCIWLNSIGAEVIGIALDPRTQEDNFVLSGVGNKIKEYREDIRNIDAVEKIVNNEKPEILFHLAAQPIVIGSYHDPILTFETNTLGTAYLLEAFRKSETLKTGIFITSDKCYDNKEWVWGYRESDPMGGHDPYSASKGAAEIIIDSFRRSYFTDGEKKIASVRAGNVIGGGDWAPHRIIADCIKAIEQEKPIEIRNPLATRPWQHVLEPLGGYLFLGALMMEEGGYDEAWNFGPTNDNTKPVKVLVEELIRQYGFGSWEDKSNNNSQHEANLLSLDISKAIQQLKWKPVLNFEETVEYTVEWYKKYKQDNVLNLCLNQIERYTNKWKS